VSAFEVLALNTSIPQIQAAQAGDSYVMVVNATTPALRITQTGTGDAILVEDAANPDSTPFVVTAAGDVGIGTNAPAYKLDVSGSVIRLNNSGSTADIFLTDSGTTNGHVRLRGESNAMKFITGNGISATLDSSGNLGIGTSPVFKIDVFGTTPAIRLKANGVGNGVKLEQSSATGDVELNVIDTYPLLFKTSNTERARITSGGEMLLSGLTTSIGSYWLQVKNTSSSANCVYLENASGNDRGILTLKHDQAAGATTGAMVAFVNSSGSAVGSITSSNTATAYNTSSDYRLKDNPQPLTNSGSFIDALKPKTWDWKADGSKGVGFIAHEVQEVSPGTVLGAKDAVDADGNPVMQAMEYGSAEFIANIVAELQSLRARVAQLEQGA
jgi:hypothetical protein